MVIPLGLSFDDVLLIPQRSEINSRAEVNLKTEIAPDFFLDIPIIATNMDGVTGVEMAVAMSKIGSLAIIPRFESPEGEANKISEIKKKKARVFGTIGLRDNFLERAELVAKAGADCVKVGVGAGSICITRIMAGAGVPQITALQWAAKAAKKFKNKFILADGGIKNSGDIVKALAAGANAVSLGSLLAGTDEAPGEIIIKNGISYKEYNGSTSRKEKDRQGKNDLHIEGVEALVKYKGPVSGVLDQLCAGVRSGLSYCGAKNIAELQKKAKFVQITHAGLSESRAHTVEVL